MAVKELIPLTADVALRKESVDRNIGLSYDGLIASGRSPQGERG